MILLDGHPVPSCSTPVWSAAGRDIVTVEGLGADGERLRAAFAAEQAAQCGYRLSGMLGTAGRSLVREGASADGNGVGLRAALDRHLCRCGTHPRILRGDHPGGHAMTGTITLPGSLAKNPRLSRWLSLGTDGTVTLRIGKAELGQGIVAIRN